MTTMIDAILSLLESSLRVSTPLIFAAIGGLWSERSGVVNIALEGMMLVGAFFGAVVALTTHSPWAGFLAAGVAGLATATLYGLSVIRFRADQIVAGTAINMLAAGVPPFLSKILYASTAGTPSLALDQRFHSAPVWMALAAVGIAWVWIRWTPAGLWLSFAGEHPQALDASGVRVNRVRWAYVMTSGFLAGLGGASLSLFLASSFTRNMTAGRGFMALAALILGKWKPVPTLLACLLFGVADAAQIRLQGVELGGGMKIPVQFIQILPYLVTLFVLAGFVGRSRAPKSLGIPFRKS